MISGWGRNGGRGGRGCTKHGQGHNYSGTNSISKKYIFTDLGNNIFDYGDKAAVDHIRKLWEKLFHNFGTNYGQDIINELIIKVKLNLVTPFHLTEVLVRHVTREALFRTVQSNIQVARRAQASMIRAAATAEPSDAYLPMNISVMDNDIAKVYSDLVNDIYIYMLESEKNSYGNEWRAYREHNSNL